MNELKNRTNVVIEKVGKLGLVHKKKTNKKQFSRIFVYLKNYSIIIVQVRYITIETNEVARIGYSHVSFSAIVLR